MKLKAISLHDFYKSGHIFQYPKGTELVYSNWTPRSDRLASILQEYWDKKVVFYGIQGVVKSFLIELFNDTFFNVEKEEAVSKYKRRVDTSLGAGAVPVEHIAALWDLGFLPIEIKALPEGSRVNIGVPVFTIKNSEHLTRPEFFWVTNFLETLLSAENWKMITVATIAYEYHKIIHKYANLTGGSKEFIPWQGHDFSMRGHGGCWDAASSGSGHLLSFLGTDTIPAIDYLEDYYNCNAETELIGGSVPATEHSVMCMGGNESEIETFRRLITEVYPSGIVSIVSDTWDFWKVITEYSVDLKDVIEARTPDALGMAKVVFRPDSGDPVDIICGTISAINIDDSVSVEEAKNIALKLLCEDPPSIKPIIHQAKYKYLSEGMFRYKGAVWAASAYLSGISTEREGLKIACKEVEFISFEQVDLTPEQKGAVECLWDIFGGTTNEKGYRTLNQRVGLIYGDSITLQRAESILYRLKEKGFASDNIVFGIGSYTYQYVTRDTFGQAMKATFGIVNGEGRELFKDPVTDAGTKRSAKGLLRVEKEGENFVLYDQQTWEQEEQGVMELIFKDGRMVKETSLKEIRQRLLD